MPPNELPASSFPAVEARTRSECALERPRDTEGKESVEVIELDLASLKSVRAAADKLVSDGLIA
jgi:hypothetical protein